MNCRNLLIISIFFTASAVYGLAPQTSIPPREFEPEKHVFKSKEALGEHAAEAIAALIKKNNREKRRTVLGLATGSTPIPTYQALLHLFRETDPELDFSNVITFNLDEYQGLPRAHPESYYSFMHTQLFNSLLYSEENPRGIKKENIHIPNGWAKKWDDLSEAEQTVLEDVIENPGRFEAIREGSPLTKREEVFILGLRAKEYERLLEELGPVDLQILGIGENGHIGFAEPGSAHDGPTMVVALTESTRRANARFFDGDMSQVPTHALTMGIGTIRKARQIFLMATGEKKARAIQKTVEEKVSLSVPASALRYHPDVKLLIDFKAASLLHNPLNFPKRNPAIDRQSGIASSI